MGDVQTYRGKHILVKFEGARCIHSRHCVLERPDVFVPNAPGEWIQPDGAHCENVAAIARECPSGAITYERLDEGAPQEAAPPVNLARVRENGPIALNADMEIEGHGPMLRATLCRCGASKNKPFCDTRHNEIGFAATGEPATKPSEPLAERGGKLTIKPAKDGPLLLSGNVEICAGTGRTLNRVTKAALCRCGGSSNKPYCDGTHTKIGFRSE